MCPFPKERNSSTTVLVTAIAPPPHLLNLLPQVEMPPHGNRRLSFPSFVAPALETQLKYSRLVK